MDQLKSAEWWKAAGTRAIKTAAETAVSLMPVTAAALGDVHWTVVVSSAALAAILSLLTSLAGLPEVGGGTKAAEGGEQDE